MGELETSCMPTAPRHHATQFVKPHAKSHGSARNPTRNTSRNDMGGCEDRFEQKFKRKKRPSHLSSTNGGVSLSCDNSSVYADTVGPFSIPASLSWLLRSKQSELLDSRF